jgi:hypothetical protein
MKIFHLTFNKEADGDWYIEFPGYPFAHHNLMMVAGADHLCAYVAKREGHPTKAVVDVTLDDNRIAGRTPIITMERFEKGYGARYRCYDEEGETPVIEWNGRELDIPTAWLCPVTLLVLFRYPKRINLYLLD